MHKTHLLEPLRFALAAGLRESHKQYLYAALILSDGITKLTKSCWLRSGVQICKRKYIKQMYEFCTVMTFDDKLQLFVNICIFTKILKSLP